MKRRNLYFTMVELLVVIAIIMILASILMPAISKAKDVAKKISCSNNMKQIGISFNFYNSDNSEYFPYYRDASSSTWNQTIGNAGYLGKNYAKIFQCKSKRYSGALGFSLPYYIDYGYNYLNIGSSNRITWGDRTPAKLNQVLRPSSKILVCDTFWNNPGDINYTRGFYVVEDSDDGGFYYPEARHSDGLNILWIDMHIAYKKVNKINPYNDLGRSSDVNNSWTRK